MRLRGIMILVGVLCSFSIGQPKADETKCPNPDKLLNLCSLVGDRTKDQNPHGPFWQYLYQRRILEASCALNDDEKTQGQKVRAMWAEFEGRFVCSNVQFDVAGGSVIKYGVSSKFDDFLDDLTLWKVNLNKVDAEDNRTVLDYILFHIGLNRGTPVETKLFSYYRQLRDAGAKHCIELPTPPKRTCGIQKVPKLGKVS